MARFKKKKIRFRKKGFKKKSRRIRHRNYKQQRVGYRL